MEAKKILYEGTVVPPTLYKVKLWGLTEAEWRKLDILGCLRSMCGLTL